MNDTDHIDYFISHASGDSAWAEWIDQVVRRAGYSTITDIYDFRAGQNFILLMEDALRRADRLLLIWSPRARDRYMVEVEWSGAMARNRDRVVPVIVEECEVPAVLSATLHVNLTTFIDGQAASAVLLHALQGRERPTATVYYPRAEVSVATPFPVEVQHRIASRRSEEKPNHSNTDCFSLDDYILSRPHHATFSVAEDISEVWMIAKGFESFLHNNARHVERAVTQGTRFRFLMHDPENVELMRMMAHTSYSNRRYEDVASRLRGAVEEIHRLASGRGEAIELRLASWPIVAGYTFFQPNHNRGYAYIEFFGYRISLNERQASTVFREREPRFFTYLQEQFLSQWRDAKKVVWDD